jgi:multidrug efflux pump subunit AcrA (membrane-fusion protein)
MTMGVGHARRVVAVGVIAALAAGGIWTGVAVTSASPSSVAGATPTGPAGLATVVRADLAAQQTISGTVGYDGAWTVVLPAGTTAPALAQAQAKVTTDQLALAADRTSLQDTTAADASTTAANQQAVSAAQAAEDADQAQLHSDQAGLRAAEARAASLCAPASTAPAAACTAAPQAVSQWQAKVNADSQAAGHDQAALQQASAGVTAAQQHAAQTEHQGESQVAGAELNLAADQAALASGQQTALTPGATFTGLPVVGQVVRLGQALYALDGHGVPLLYGPVPQWRAFRAGMADGPDIAELNQALTALGFESGTSPGIRFTDATAAGIRRLQASLGLDQSGALLVGEVVFERNAVRIASVNVYPGGPAQPGTTVLSATSTTLVVTALVPLNDVGSVTPGAPVTVDLPAGRTGVPGVVRDVGTSVSPGSGSGQGGGGGNGAGPSNGASGGQGGSGATTVPTTVTLSDPSVARGLDQAAVLVHVTTQTARGVLAVPVDALLALNGGGEGVEVVAGGVHRIVAVQTGLFSGTQVAITAPGITEGDQVEVPAP